METALQPYPATRRRSAALPTDRGRTPGAAIRGWLRIVAAWVDRRRQRRALARLDARLLADVGITRAEAAREIATPFWR